MKRITFFCVFLLAISYGFAQHSTIKEYKKVFTTYPYSDPNPIPEKGRIYPYFRFDGFTDKPIQKEWKVVELENDFIKVMILPEVGGKIWAAIEKSTNQSFIYYNHVVKFRDVAMRGPWTSGGIEANYGIIGHTPNSVAPVDYLLKQNPDNSASCFISWLDLLTRTKWTIEINLPQDKAYFTTRSFWYNNTPTHQPYYHWMNVGIKTKGNLQFVYPGTRYLGHGGEYADWPVNKENKKNIDFYEQNDFGSYKSYHVFGTLANFFGAYWHDDDFGMARYSLHEEKAGKKIWIWGLSQEGMIWEKLLTDHDGQYAEIQSGRLFNQNAPESSLTPFKHVSFEPYATDEWTEYWYPVLKTKGFVTANEYGALNYRVEAGYLKMNFSPVRNIDEPLVVKAGEKTIYEKKLSLKPLQVFADSLKIAELPGNITVSIGDKLRYSSNTHTDNLNRPVDAPKNFDWNSAYGNYVAGKEWMDQRAYTQAAEKLEQSLKLDSNFVPALNRMTELLFHNMEYEKALVLAKRALSIDSHDGASNYYYGLVNECLGNSTDAKDGYDVSALSPAYRGAAYTNLASLYLKENNLLKSVLYADKALYYNAGNIAAYKAKAIVARKNNDPTTAIKFLSSIDDLDPLNHFSSFEKYLLSKKEADKKSFIDDIKNELPYQTFLEQAIEYTNLGCLEDALTLLKLSPSHALVSYWKAYINQLLGQNTHEDIADGNRQPASFVLPFRSETGTLLEWLIKQTTDWKPQYYLALLYRDRDRIQESKALLDGIGNKPSESFFYAVRASVATGNNEKEADLLKAYDLNKNDWRSAKALSEFYAAEGQVAKALDIAGRFYKKNPANYIIGMLVAKLMIANQKYPAAGKLLSSLNIIPFEGATEGRQLYRQSMLMQALESFNKKQYKAASDFVAQARTYPENLGSGKPYDDLIDTRLEDYVDALVFEKTTRNNDATAFLSKIISNPIEKSSYKSNIIVQAWALQKLGREADASRIIEEFLKTEKSPSLVKWVSDMFHQSKMPSSNDINEQILTKVALLK